MFSRGHRCSSKLFLLIADDDNLSSSDTFIADWGTELAENEALAQVLILIDGVSPTRMLGFGFGPQHSAHYTLTGHGRQRQRD